MTALAWASYKGHKQIVNMLLKAGAKPDVQDQVLDQEDVHVLTRM